MKYLIEYKASSIEFNLSEIAHALNRFVGNSITDYLMHSSVEALSEYSLPKKLTEYLEIPIKITHVDKCPIQQYFNAPITMHILLGMEIHKKNICIVVAYSEKTHKISSIDYYENGNYISNIFLLGEFRSYITSQKNLQKLQTPLYENGIYYSAIIYL